MIKRTLIPTLLLTSSIASAGTAPGPLPDDQVAPELIELRGALIDAGEQAAQQSPTRFRALCDEHGWPLVGNILPKDGADAPPMAPVDPAYQPSDFCADVRAGQQRA